MKCEKCGQEISEADKFCPHCGAKITVEPEVIDPNQPKTEAKCWSVFAKVSKILGIVTISVCWIPFLFGISSGIPGIVFACLGTHASSEEAQQQRKLGLILSIVGTAVSFVAYIIYCLFIGRVSFSF